MDEKSGWPEINIFSAATYVSHKTYVSHFMIRNTQTKLLNSKQPQTHGVMSILSRENGDSGHARVFFILILSEVRTVVVVGDS